MTSTLGWRAPLSVAPGWCAVSRTLRWEFPGEMAATGTSAKSNSSDRRSQRRHAYSTVLRQRHFCSCVSTHRFLLSTYNLLEVIVRHRSRHDRRCPPGCSPTTPAKPRACAAAPQFGLQKAECCPRTGICEYAPISFTLRSAPVRISRKPARHRPSSKPRLVPTDTMSSRFGRRRRLRQGRRIQLFQPLSLLAILKRGGHGRAVHSPVQIFVIFLRQIPVPNQLVVFPDAHRRALDARLIVSDAPIHLRALFAVIFHLDAFGQDQPLVLSASASNSRCSRRNCALAGPRRRTIGLARLWFCSRLTLVPSQPPADSPAAARRDGSPCSAPARSRANPRTARFRGPCPLICRRFAAAACSGAFGSFSDAS